MKINIIIFLFLKNPKMLLLKFFSHFLDISKETLKNKSLGRTLVNLRLKEKNLILSGKILDLGGRELYWIKGQPRGGSYLRFLKFDRVEILRIDIDEEAKPDYKIDFEKDSLPFGDNSVDTVLAFNLFEHIYNYKFLIKYRQNASCLLCILIRLRGVKDKPVF